MQTNSKQNKTRKLILCAVFSALAYVAMLTIKIEVAGFLKYEPKDVIIALGGFIAGPLGGIAIAFVSCFIEAFTVGDTGPIGFLMNFLSSACFAGLSSVIYMKKRTVSGAVIGLAAATSATTLLMILWNYIITPMYMHVERSVVEAMILPVFLPFNLLKYSLGSAFAMLLYKPVSKAVKLAGFGNILSAQHTSAAPKKYGKQITAAVAVGSIAVIALCVYFMFLLVKNS